MPVVTFHLVDGRHGDAEVAELLRRSCALFAEVLQCPVGRVRAFAAAYRPELACAGGELVSGGAAEAPYFHFVLLRGRPVEQRRRLLEGFTDLLVEVLGADRAQVRGGVQLVDPEDWAIGGVPAAAARRDEVAARAAATAQVPTARG